MVYCFTAKGLKDVYNNVYFSHNLKITLPQLEPDPGRNPSFEPDLIPGLYQIYSWILIPIIVENRIRIQIKIIRIRNPGIRSKAENILEALLKK